MATTVGGDEDAIAAALAKKAAAHDLANAKNVEKDDAKKLAAAIERGIVRIYVRRLLFLGGLSRYADPGGWPPVAVSVIHSWHNDAAAIAAATAAEAEATRKRKEIRERRPAAKAEDAATLGMSSSLARVRRACPGCPRTHDRRRLQSAPDALLTARRPRPRCAMHPCVEHSWH